MLVAGATEGNFPSLSRPEPMFDLAALSGSRSRSEQVRERLEDERRLFRMVLGRARRGRRAGRGRHASRRRRAHAALAVRRRARRRLDAGARGRSTTSRSASREAAAAWRRQLADPGAEAWRRLAALDGLRALGDDPRAGGSSATGPTPAGRCTRRFASRIPGCRTWTTASCSTCSATSSGSAGWPATRRGSASSCTASSRTSSRARLGKTKEEILDRGRPPLARRRSSPPRPCRSAHRKLVDERMFKNWWFEYGEEDSLGNEVRFEFDFEGTTIVGVIDRIGPMPERGHAHHRLQDRQRRQRAEGRGEPAARHLLPGRAGVRGRSPPYRPVRQVELAYIKGDWKRGELGCKPTWQIDARRRGAVPGHVVRSSLAG